MNFRRSFSEPDSILLIEIQSNYLWEILITDTSIDLWLILTDTREEISPFSCFDGEPCKLNVIIVIDKSFY